MPQLLGPNGGPARLFARRCTLDIGREENSVQLQSAFRVTGLRIAFKIRKSDKPEPNSSQIRVWNLSEQHRTAVELKGTRCVLSAGYPDSEAQIFSGNVHFAQSQKEGNDWLTTLELGDGQLKFKTARVGQYFPAGTKLLDVVLHVGQQLVSDLGNLRERVSQLSEEFSEGITIHGSAAETLTRLLRPHGISWSIQDGRIEALAPSEYLPGTGPLISVDTGMVGSPGYGHAKKTGGPRYLKVKSLLQPAMRPGQAFELRSREINGSFRCHLVEHEGDTEGPPWYSEIEALPRR